MPGKVFVNRLSTVVARVLNQERDNEAFKPWRMGSNTRIHTKR
jgi:hypothetical protein